MSDENVHSCLHLMYHGWKAAHHIQVFLQSEPTPMFNHELNVKLNTVVFLQHNIPLCFHTPEVLYMFFTVYNTLYHAYFHARFLCFPERHIIYYTTQYSCIFTSRKRPVYFAPYITLSLGQDFLNKIIVFILFMNGKNSHTCIIYWFYTAWHVRCRAFPATTLSYLKVMEK